MISMRVLEGSRVVLSFAGCSGLASLFTRSSIRQNDSIFSKLAMVAGRSAELCPAHFTGQNLDSMRERRCKSLDCGRGDHGRARAYATVLLCLGFQESNRATDESLRVRRRIAKKLTSAKASNRPSGRLPKATNSALYGTLQGNQWLRFPLL